MNSPLNQWFSGVFLLYCKLVFNAALNGRPTGPTAPQTRRKKAPSDEGAGKNRLFGTDF